MKNKTKKPNKRLVSSVLLTAAALFIAFYIVYQLSGYFSVTLATAPAVSATEKVTETYEGYIMRNETVIFSDNGGYCDYLCESGSYPGIENPIANVYSTADESLVNEIKALDRMIYLTEYLSANIGTVSLSSAVETVRDEYHELMAYLADRETHKIPSSKEEVLQSIFVRDNSGIKTGEVQKSLNDLILRRESLLSQLGAFQTVYSPDIMGNFFHGGQTCDGLEEAYSSANIDKMTLSDLYAMLEKEPVAEYGEKHPIGTYTTDPTWYLAVPVGLDKAAGYKVGKNYNVSFPYDCKITLRMKLHKIVSESDSNDAFMIFSCESTPNGFERLRHRTVEIEKAEYSGYRVPNEAIRVKNGGNGVYILSSGYAEWRNINIIYQNSLYSIVEAQPPEPTESSAGNISQNDILIISRSGFTEGEPVK